MSNEMIITLVSQMNWRFYMELTLMSNGANLFLL